MLHFIKLFCPGVWINRKCYEYLWIIFKCMYMYIYACFSLISVFFSRALCLYIMMDASDDYAGWIVSDWMFKNKSFIEGRWTLKMQRNFACFLLNASGARIKKNVIEYNKHVMLEEELWMQWLWFYGSIINTACIVIIREMLQFNQ